VLIVKCPVFIMLVVLTAFADMAFGENNGVCPPLPPLPSSKNVARFHVGDTSVTTSVLAVISDTGYVCSARLLDKADKEVATEITTAIRQWHFDPAMKDGYRVPVLVTIQVNVKRDEAGKIIVSSSPRRSDSNYGNARSATNTNTRTEH
jgi:hypothetical protein